MGSHSRLEAERVALRFGPAACSTGTLTSISAFQGVPLRDGAKGRHGQACRKYESPYPGHMCRHTSGREVGEMHTRVLTFTGAKNIDDGVAFVRDNAVPVLEEQKGYRDITASADRDGSVLGVLSLWETEADREASFGALAELRQKGLDVVGGDLKVESFEELVVEMASPPAVGSALMVTPWLLQE